MPSSPNYVRNYKQEYKNYHSKPSQIKRRDSRNKARRLMEDLGYVRKGDGKDVDHKNSNPLQSSRKNLRVQSKHSNRSYARTKKAREKRG